jgi:hypothetical protein
LTRHIPNSAEQSFFATVMGRGPLAKTAVDLDPGVAEALDLPTVSPSILKELERQAPAATTAPAVADTAQEPQEVQEAQDAQDDGLEAVAPSAAMEVDGFDRADAEPELEEGEEPAPEPALPSRRTHGRIFTDKRAHPLQLLDTLTMRYRTAWADWEPATLWWALRKDFGPVGDLTRNKIMALRVAVTSDMPWLDWDIFEDSGLAWNDIVPIIGAFQPMSPAQTAFAVSILRAIRADEEFDAEVIAYIGAILEDHGWVYAPEEFFGPVQGLLDRKKWTVGFRMDVAAAWERIKDVDPTTIEWRPDHPLDIHLLKLVVVKAYLDERGVLRQAVPGAPAGASTVAPPVP